MHDRTLEKLSRKVALAIHKDCCFFCGAHYQHQEVDCHHTIKRRVWLLRYDWRNLIPACRWVHSGNQHLGMSCHQYAETPKGKALIAEYQKPYLDYLQERSQPAKQWLVKMGITKSEFKRIMEVELTELWGYLQMAPGQAKRPPGSTIGHKDGRR